MTVLASLFNHALPLADPVTPSYTSLRIPRLGTGNGRMKFLLAEMY